MKVVLFCGGMGMRLRDYSDQIPKPLVDVGQRPILWHLMKYYSHLGHKDFVLCLGHGATVIKDYFLNYNPYVSENVMLYPNFTAIQNIDFFARLGGKTEYSRTDYEEVLSRVGLQSSAFDRRLKGFSKGMRQKCGIAIAILKDAPAILLDEPTSGLDPKAGIEFTRLVQSLSEEGKAILMSTHDIFRAKDLAHIVGIMNEGRIVMQRTHEELVGENLEDLYVKYMAGYMDE